jgi:hypothetical protein
MDSTESQRNTIDAHGGEFETVEEAREFAVLCSTDITLRDAAGFKRGYVKRTGEWSLT